MLEYTVEAALGSGVADRVYVSSEDDEVGSIGERSGATFHRRPFELAGDLVSATDVCIEVLETLEARGENFDAVLCLQPSSPLRTALDIQESCKRFIDRQAQFLVSVTPIDPHYFHWAVHDSGEGWRMYFGEQFLLERPLLPPVYRPNGAIKIGQVESLRRTHNFFGERLEVYMMPDERSLHVGEPADFDLASFYLRERGAS